MACTLRLTWAEMDLAFSALWQQLSRNRQQSDGAGFPWTTGPKQERTARNPRHNATNADLFILVDLTVRKCQQTRSAKTKKMKLLLCFA